MQTPFPGNGLSSSCALCNAGVKVDGARPKPKFATQASLQIPTTKFYSHPYFRIEMCSPKINNNCLWLGVGDVSYQNGVNTGFEI
jgi:hypothetical protein